jgi:hypothetical protein
MVSWDSTKLRLYHKEATKPGLTKRHKDVYNYDGKELDRKQAMIIKQETGAISLGWVPFSHKKEIQEELQKYFNKSPDKFSSVEDPELNKVIDKYWRSYDECFVIWEQQTIHYECSPLIMNDYLIYNSFNQPIFNIKKLSIRVVIGTQQPKGLNNKQLKQLAIISEYGYTPAIYNNKNKGTMIASNTVNKKTTQYRIAREPKITENEIYEKYKREYDEIIDNNNIDIYIEKIPKVLKELYGIYN